jgi:Flp pilus assembly protein TadD
MLLRFLATGLLVISPALVAAQTQPESYNQCRLAEDPQSGITARKEAQARAFSLGSASVASLNNRGVTMLESGDTAAAIVDFGSALTLMPDDARVLDTRATALCRAGKFDASFADRLATIELG